jgi:hypothetical protein
MLIYDFLKVNENYLSGTPVHTIWAYYYTGLTLWSRDLPFCLALYPMVLCDRRTMYRWSHHYGFASSMGDSRLDSVRLLVYDGMQQYSRHRYFTMGPTGQCTPIKNGLKACIDHIKGGKL